MELDKTRGIRTTTSVNMEKDKNNKWLVKIKSNFGFSTDLVDWEEIEYESMAIADTIEKAYSDAIQQIVESMENDEEATNFFLQN